MTVKSKRGRRRYIAFKVSPGLTAPELSQKVPRQFRVIQCAGGMAIVRCSPETADGCKAAVMKVKPDIAICIEGAPADDTFMPEYNIQNGLHRGPMLRYMDISMITHPRFIRYAFSIADELGIRTQKAVRRGGGTNGAMIHNAPGAPPAIVIACPVRYTHSHHTYTALDDFENTVALVCGILRRLDASVIEGF